MLLLLVLMAELKKILLNSNQNFVLKERCIQTLMFLNWLYYLFKILILILLLLLLRLLLCIFQIENIKNNYISMKGTFSTIVLFYLVMTKANHRIDLHLIRRLLTKINIRLQIAMWELVFCFHFYFPLTWLLHLIL